MSVLLFGVASITLKLALNGARVLQSPQASANSAEVPEDSENEAGDSALVSTSATTPMREVTINISRSSSSHQILTSDTSESPSTPTITISTPLRTTSLRLPMTSPFTEYSQRIHAILTQIAIDEGYFSHSDARHAAASILDYSSLLLTDSPAISNTSTADTPALTPAVREIRDEVQDSIDMDNSLLLPSMSYTSSFLYDVSAESYIQTVEEIYDTMQSSFVDESWDEGFDVLSPARWEGGLDAVDLSFAVEEESNIDSTPVPSELTDVIISTPQPDKCYTATPVENTLVTADLVVADVLTPEQREAEIIERAVEYLQKIETAKLEKMVRIQQLQAQRSTGSSDSVSSSSKSSGNKRRRRRKINPIAIDDALSCTEPHCDAMAAEVSGEDVLLRQSSSTRGRKYGTPMKVSPNVRPVRYHHSPSSDTVLHCASLSASDHETPTSPISNSFRYPLSPIHATSISMDSADTMELSDLLNFIDESVQELGDESERSEMHFRGAVEMPLDTIGDAVDMPHTEHNSSGSRHAVQMTDNIPDQSEESAPDMHSSANICAGDVQTPDEQARQSNPEQTDDQKPSSEIQTNDDNSVRGLIHEHPKSSDADDVESAHDELIKDEDVITNAEDETRDDNNSIKDDIAESSLMIQQELPLISESADCVGPSICSLECVHDRDIGISDDLFVLAQSDCDDEEEEITRVTLADEQALLHIAADEKGVDPYGIYQRGYDRCDPHSDDNDELVDVARFTLADDPTVASLHEADDPLATDTLLNLLLLPSSPVQDQSEEKVTQEPFCRIYAEPESSLQLQTDFVEPTTHQQVLADTPQPSSVRTPLRRRVSSLRSNSKEVISVSKLLRDAEAQDSSFKRRASPHLLRSPSSRSTPRAMQRQLSTRSSMEFPVRSVSPVHMSPQSSFCENSLILPSEVDAPAPSLVQFVELLWSPGLEVFELHNDGETVVSVTKRRLRLSSAGMLFWGPESRNPADIVRRLVLSRSLTPRSINEFEIPLVQLQSARVLGLEACIGKSDASSVDVRLELLEIIFSSHSLRVGIREASCGLTVQCIVDRLCELQGAVNDDEEFKRFVGLCS